MRKSKYLEDAAKVIDGRVAALEAELARDQKKGLSGYTIAADRAAILEAQHCARLIRSLKLGTYRDPYAAARDHWNHGRARDNVIPSPPEPRS